MNHGLQGRLALITGASRGLGRAVAMALAKEGVRLILIARNSAVLNDLVLQLSPFTEVYGYSIDLLAEIGHLEEKFLEDIFPKTGVPEIVVHNLGGSLAVSDPLAGINEWQNVFNLNVGIGIELNRIIIPSMRKRRWGRVVHVSSSATYTFGGYPAYTVAKAALNSYVTRVSHEMAADGVVMSAVSPGPLRIEGRYLSDLFDNNLEAKQEYCRNHLAIGRLGEVDEIAHAIVYLCSDQASFAVGTILSLDGGSK